MLVKKVFQLLVYFVLSLVINSAEPVLAQEQSALVDLLDSLEHSPPDTGRIKILLDISLEYQNRDIQKALLYSHKALTLSKKLKNPNKQIQTLYQTAKIYYIIAKLDSSEHYINVALEIINKGFSDDRIKGKFYNLKGSILRKKGDYIGAAELYHKSIIIFENLKDTNELADSYNRLAIQYEHRSMYDSAIHYYIEANKNYSLVKDSIGLVKILLNTANVFSKLNENNKALDYYLSCEKILKNNKNLQYEANCYNSIGRMLSRLEKYDSALLYFDKSITLYDSIGLNAEKSAVYLNLAGVYFELAQYDKALAIYQDALNQYKKNNDIEGIIMARFNIALINERLGKYTKALQIYDTCLALAKQYEFNGLVTNTYFNIYRTWALSGDYKKAYKYQETHNFWKDSIFNIEKAEIISELEIKYETEKNRAKIIMLNNESLIKDLTIKKKNIERNTAIMTGVGIITILVLLFIMLLLKAKKNRIIKEKEIQRLKEEKKALAAKSLLYGQEEERKRVATELHDGIGVLLSSVKMQFTNFIDKNPENTNLLVKATSVLEKASNDIRRISHNMMPGILTKLGLNEAIRDLLEDVNETTGIRAECQILGNQMRLAENIEIMIFRIIQELVNNVIKHARASHISLIFNLLDHETRIQFSDNGEGFNVNEVLAKKTMGIQSIQSRVHFLGGEVSIESNGEKGSIFIIVIPTMKT